MNEPGTTLLNADHLDVTMEPNGMSVPADNPRHGSQGFTREHHLGGFYVPPLLMIGVDLAIPSDRIVEPLILRKSKCGLDVGTDVSLADSSIKEKHKDNPGNLFKQVLVPGFDVRKRSMIVLARLTAVLKWLGTR